MAMAQQQRIDSIDILRGLAIMGILLVNGPQLNGSAYKDGTDFAFQSTVMDFWYSKLVFIFAVGNFYPIFACLFGLSVAIFLADKPKFLAPRLHLRRMSLLLMIGIAHAVLVWWGDILVVYSILGTGLVLLNNRTEKEILKTLAVLVIAALVLSVAIFFIHDNQAALFDAKVLRIYQSGDFWTVSKQRAADFMGVYIPGVLFPLDAYRVYSFSLYFLQLGICFVFGFWIYRFNTLKLIFNNYILSRNIVLATGAISFILSLSSALLPELDSALLVANGCFRALFYASFIFYLCHFYTIKKLLYPFSCVGRMSLSNYLFHNICLSLIFYGYGLGLYGTIGPFQQIPILVALMAASLLLSSLWFKYYNFGPIEWLWRAGTYGYFSKLSKNIDHQAA